MRGNTVSIKGNCTRDMEVRRTNSGQNAVKFGIAWNQSRKNNQGGWDEVAHYFDVELWASDNQLNAMPTVQKGMAVAVIDGHLEFQSWQDNQGNNRSRVVVRCDDPIQGLIVSAGRQQPQQMGGAPQQAAQQRQGNYAQQAPRQAYAAPQQPYQQAPLYDQDIPF